MLLFEDLHAHDYTLELKLLSILSQGVQSSERFPNKVALEQQERLFNQVFPALFYSGENDDNLKLYKVIAELYYGKQKGYKRGSGLNPYAVARLNHERTNISIDSTLYLLKTSMVEQIPLEYCVSKLKQLLFRRTSARHLLEMGECIGGRNGKHSLDDIYGKITALRKSLVVGKTSEQHDERMLDEAISIINDGTSVVRTGSHFLDSRLAGLTLGSVSGVLGQQSHFKSTFSGHIAKSIAKSGERVAIYSMEDTISMYVKRLIASEYDISLQDLLFNRVKVDPAKAKKLFKEDMGGRMSLFDTRHISTPDEIVNSILELKPKFVVVDYLQAFPFNDMVGETGRAVKLLARVARQTNSHIMILSQVGDKSIAWRDDKVPTASDTRWDSTLHDAASDMFAVYYEFKAMGGQNLLVKNNLLVAVNKAKFSGWLGRINLIIDSDAGKIIGEDR